MGELHIILGPMFSGKTTKLINLSHNYKNPIFINYKSDTRYHDSLLSTHNGITVPCIQSLFLYDILQEIVQLESDAIFINEGQFFFDVFDSVRTLVEKYNKKVYICGLDGDYQRNTFGDLLKLITLCDTVEKLSSKCDICELSAPFTYRLTKHTEQFLIGVEEYTTLCRRCYIGASNYSE